MRGSRVVVVGSGPSAVHFALTVLRKGYGVLMLDVGYEKPAAVNPEDSFAALKQNLSDPAGYFLGPNLEGLLLPSKEKREYYGIPPNKDYVFRPAAGYETRARGFAPLFSFARGGMAEAWTAGCYPFNDAELAEFPFNYAGIAPYYEEIARRIGISGEPDDLQKFFPLHGGLIEPLELDFHSRELMNAYARRRQELNSRLGCYLGRTRVATLSRDLEGRRACSKLGRCLWGCPTDSLYTPSITLRQCQTLPNFEYVPGHLVTHFEFNSGNHITAVVAAPVVGGEARKFPVETLVLAAGALPSTRIFLESVLRGAGQRLELRGLMDNRQVLMPFVNLNLIGKNYSPGSYQYHLLGMGLEMPVPREYVHGQVTTLKTALLHPIIQNLPCDLRAAMFILRVTHCALGIVNVNFHDARREGNRATLEKDSATGRERLLVHYAPPKDEAQRMGPALRRIRAALWKLGCFVPPGMAHVRPMGASAHYAGTLPMSTESKPHTASPAGQSYDFENLFLADGAAFPFLPAKNITFTLMANAVRIADQAF